MPRDENGIEYLLIDGEAYYPTTQASQLTNFAPNTIRNLTQRGELTVLRIGRRNLYKRSWLRKAIKDRTTPATL